MKTTKRHKTLVCTLSRADSAFLQVHKADAGCDQYQWERWQAILREARSSAEKRGLTVIEIYASKRYGGRALLEGDL